MRLFTVSMLLSVTVTTVYGNHADEIDNNELPGVSGYPDTDRRVHAYLPKFSKKGKGKSTPDMHNDYYEQEWTWERKSDKKSKDMKKDKKRGKERKERKKRERLLGATD